LNNVEFARINLIKKSGERREKREERREKSEYYTTESQNSELLIYSQISNPQI